MSRVGSIAGRWRRAGRCWSPSASALYTVSETEQVIITQFGQPDRRSRSPSPGLHVKLPFVQDVHRFDKRWLEWDGDANQIPTRDKKYIWVDTYARWRIADPLRFFQRLRDERGAQSPPRRHHRRRDPQRDRHPRPDRGGAQLATATFEQGEEVAGHRSRRRRCARWSTGRDKITRLILEQASQVMPEFGIELVDVQIQRINYVDTRPDRRSSSA